MSFALLLLLAAGADWRTPVAEPELADQRGGFRLPNGVDVAMTVQTDTAVNGAVVLRTVFAVDRGAPTLSVYAPKVGETVASTIARTGQAGRGAPVVSIDARGTLQITPGATTAVIGAAGRADAGVPAGLEQVAAGAVTDNGTVSQTAAGAGSRVTLQGGDLSITHLSGNALGSAIANAGNNRVIDTQTSISIDLAGATPDVVGSSMLRAEGVALDALRGRM